MRSAPSSNKISPANRPSDNTEGGVMRERQNWRIFSAFARQEYTECLQIIEEQLQDCDGMAEYPIYVKGKQEALWPHPGACRLRKLSAGRSWW